MMDEERMMDLEQARAYEVLVEGVNEDARPYRDTLYLLVDPDVEVVPALLGVCERNEIGLVELAWAEPEVFTGSGTVPAATSEATRQAFLSKVELLPDTFSPFGGAATAFIELDDPAVEPYGW